MSQPAWRGRGCAGGGEDSPALRGCPHCSCWEPSMQPRHCQRRAGGRWFVGSLWLCQERARPPQNGRGQGRRPQPWCRGSTGAGLLGKAPTQQEARPEQEGGGVGEPPRLWVQLIWKSPVLRQNRRGLQHCLGLAHQVLTCLARSPAARSHAAPMNVAFLLPAAQPLAAPQPLRLGREKSQGLFFCPFSPCQALHSAEGPSWGLPCCQDEQSSPLLHQGSKRGALCYCPVCKAELRASSPLPVLTGTSCYMVFGNIHPARNKKAGKDSPPAPSLAAATAASFVLPSSPGSAGLAKQSLCPCCGAEQPH